MKSLKVVLEAAVAGIVITLATGLVKSTPTQLVGASWYGLPVTWIRKLVLAPQYNPWVVAWGGLVMDVVFWFIVALIVLYAIMYFKKPMPKSTKSRGKR